ncbi:MAG: DUF4175 family protein [Planctomycetota bacterium]
MKRLPETDRLEARLVNVGRAVAAQYLYRGFIRLLTATGAFLLLLFAADFLTRFPYWLRVGAWAAALVYGMWWFRQKALKPASRRLEAQEVSLLVERSDPSLQSRLISTLQFQASPALSPGTSADLVDGLVNQTFGLIDRVQFRRIVDTSWRGPALRKFLGVLLLVAAVILLVPTYSEAFAKRLVLPHVSYPTRTQITAIDMPDLIAYGDPIPVQVTGAGRIPELGRIVIEDDEGEDFEYDLQPTAPDAPSFTVELAALTRPATMWVELGDAVSEPIRIEPHHRPLLESIQVAIAAPAYAGEEDRTEQTGNVRVLAGSELDFTFTVSKALEEFALETNDSLQGADEPSSEDGLVWRWSTTATESFGFTLAMQDDIGLTAKDVPQYRVTAIRDRPPVIRIESPRGAAEMAPVSRIPLEFTVTDDIGVDAVRIEYVIEESSAGGDGLGYSAAPITAGREAPRKIYERIDDFGHTTYTHAGFWENSKTTVRPGQVIRFWIIAVDNHPDGQSTESAEQMLRVISTAEYRRVLWSKLGEHIDRVDEMVVEINDSERRLEDVEQGMNGQD